MFREIEAEEYFKLYKEHKDNLCAHRCFTDSTGYGYTWSSGNPEFMTEWGFKDSDTPFIKVKSITFDGVEEHKYFLYCK